MSPVQKKDAGPHVDRKLMLTGEIVIQAAQQQLFDTRFTIPLRPLGSTGVESARIGHRKNSSRWRRLQRL
jgi:hypothetical protein